MNLGAQTVSAAGGDKSLGRKLRPSKGEEAGEAWCDVPQGSVRTLGRDEEQDARKVTQRGREKFLENASERVK